MFDFMTIYMRLIFEYSFLINYLKAYNKFWNDMCNLDTVMIYNLFKFLRSVHVKTGYVHFYVKGPILLVVTCVVI